MTMLDAPETIKTPVGVRLIRRDRVDHVRKPVCVAECNLNDWKPYADKLDWSVLDDCDDWGVEIVYDDGSDFPIASVRIEGNDHAVFTICPEGHTAQRPVSVKQIIPTTRLFLSAQVTRGNLKIGYKNFEQLGGIVTAKPAMMVVTRRVLSDE